MSDVAASLAQDLDRDGYAVLRGVVDPALAGRVRTSLEHHFDGHPEGRITNAWTRVPEVRRLAADPELVRIAGRALGSCAVPFQTLDFCVGTSQAPHADTIHFDTVPSGGVCALWVALEPVEADQGPVEVYPGSHRWPVDTPDTLGLDPTSFDVASYESSVRRRIEEHAAVAKPVEMDVGDVLVWSANLVHGGGRKVDGSTRWSQATHYVRDGEVLVTPMHSAFSHGLYEVRTVVDIATGRVAGVAPTAPPILHLPGRRLSRVGEPRGGAGARCVSTLVGSWRRARTRAALAVASMREPVPM